MCAFDQASLHKKQILVWSVPILTAIVAAIYTYRIVKWNPDASLTFLGGEIAFDGTQTLISAEAKLDCSDSGAYSIGTPKALFGLINLQGSKIPNNQIAFVYRHSRSPIRGNITVYCKGTVKGKLESGKIYLSTELYPEPLFFEHFVPINRKLNVKTVPIDITKFENQSFMGQH